MNRRDIKRKLLGLRWVLFHYQTADPRKRELQVARGLSGVRLLILHFSFNFSNPSNLQHFIFSSI